MPVAAPAPTMFDIIARLDVAGYSQGLPSRPMASLQAAETEALRGARRASGRYFPPYDLPRIHRAFRVENTIQESKSRKEGSRWLQWKTVSIVSRSQKNSLQERKSTKRSDPRLREAGHRAARSRIRRSACSSSFCWSLRRFAHGDHRRHPAHEGFKLPLKLESRCQLHKAWIRSAHDMTEVGIFHLPVDRCWSVKLRMVERIECLCAKLH